MYTSNLCYGLVSPNEVPDICDFPIYVSLGTLNVTLKVNVTSIVLSDDDISLIREFNVMVLSDILKCLREFVVADIGKDAETMLLVPVDKNLGCIDFNVLKEYKTIKQQWQELTTDERLNLNVTQETYLRKVVSPWYREMGVSIYFTYLLCEELLFDF